MGIREFEQAPGPTTAGRLLVESLLWPHHVFAEVRLDGPLLPTLLYGTAIGTVLMIASIGDVRGLIQWVAGLQPAARSAIEDTLRRVPGGVGPVLLGETGLLAPRVVAAALAMALTGLLSGTLALHFCLRMAGAAAGGIGGTLRVMAYASASGLVGLIPAVGGLLAAVVFSVQQVVGLRAVHAASLARVILGLVLPLLLASLVVVALVLAIGLPPL